MPTDDQQAANRSQGYFLVSFVLLLVVWQVVTATSHLVNPLFLPSPGQVLVAAGELFQAGFLLDILATVGRVAVAFVVSIVVALPVAILLSESRAMQKILTPYIDFIRYIPVPVLIPLMILFFGIGEEAKIVLLFIGTFFQVVLLFDADLARIPREYFDLSYCLHFTTTQRLSMKIRAALPAMYDNMRISLGLCWSYVIIAELIASQLGIGHMIKEAQRFSHTADVFVGIIVMGLIGYATDAAFRRSAKSLFPYLGEK